MFVRFQFQIFPFIIVHPVLPRGRKMLVFEPWHYRCSGLGRMDSLDDNVDIRDKVMNPRADSLEETDNLNGQLVSWCYVYLLTDFLQMTGKIIPRVIWTHS